METYTRLVRTVKGGRVWGVYYKQTRANGPILSITRAEYLRGRTLAKKDPAHYEAF